MNELNDEIKLTISLMRDDIDDGIYDELKSHLRSLLEMKRCDLQKSLPVGYWIDDTCNQAPPEMIVKLYSRSDEAKPLTAEELKAGGWWCGDTSEACRLAFVANGVQTEAENWNDKAQVRCAYKLQSDFHVYRAHMAIDVSTLKQIYRIGGNFYWGEK